MNVFAKAPYVGLVCQPGSVTSTSSSETLERNSNSIFLIPGNIYHFLKSRGNNIVDAVNYRNARKILSQDELVQWAWLNRVFMYRSTAPVCSVGLTHFSPVFENLSSGEELNEFITTIEKQIINDDAVSKTFAARLCEKIPYGQTPYIFVATRLGLAVVIEDGFMTHMQNKDMERQFVRLYLENAQTFFTTEKLSSLPIYKMYLKGFALK